MYIYNYIFLYKTEIHIQQYTILLLFLCIIHCTYKSNFLNITRLNYVLYIGELLHCTAPGLHLASHRGLPRCLLCDSPSQRTGVRPNWRKPAWLQNTSSITSTARGMQFHPKSVTLGVISLVLPLLCQSSGCSCHDTCFMKQHWYELRCHSYIKSGRDTTHPIVHQGISRVRSRKVRGKCTTCFNLHSKVRLVAKIYEYVLLLVMTSTTSPPRLQDNA